MRILLAEDDRIIADGLQRSLRKAGYAVDCVADGADADAALASQEFDLLILDLGLPGLSGIEVCQEIRARPEWDDIKIIMLTAKGRDTEVQKGLALGADAYVTKPFSTRELVARVRSVLLMDSAP